MTTIAANLNFNGNCEEVFNFYKSVFGGEFASKMKFNEMPGNKMSKTEGEKIMHIALPINKDSILMGSDAPAQMPKPVHGTNFTLCIMPESEKEADRLFKGLSAGGKVTMPLAKAFWGSYFGMFTDKFGIQWMVNYDYPK